MAKFHTATIAAAILFCLFTVSAARATPESDDVSAAATVLTTQVNVDPAALRLPSEPVNTETAGPNPDAVVSAVPLTEISFRPINRRFHARSKRPCRHHFKFYPAAMRTENEAAEINYGNDMILPTGENSDFEEPIIRGGGKRIPGRWMRMPHHHHHHLRHRHNEITNIDSDRDNKEEEEEERVKKVAFKRYDYDRFDREKRLKKLREHFRARIEEEEKPKKKTNFMKGVRKFLDRYI